MRSQRRWHAILPRTGLQLRLFIPLLAAIALFDIVILNLVLWVLREMSTALPDLTAGQVAILDDLRRRLLYYAAVALLFPAVLSVFIMAFATHRVVGPLVAIRRHIRALIEGDLAKELRLRRDDEFGDLASDLNELTAKLRTSK